MIYFFIQTFYGEGLKLSTCTYSEKCSGCSRWSTPYSDQISNKISRLKELLNENTLSHSAEIQFLSCGESGLRNRVDFTLEFDEKTGCRTFGFYDRNKQLMQIDKCLQLNPELQIAYSEFIKFGFHIKKGSVRLRVGPTGLKGCWLDFSNMDIKHLLEDQKVLMEVLDKGFIVEIGQKGKQLVREDNVLRLRDPVARNWMKTTDSSGNELQLNCLISDFTQPSWLSAGAMVSQVLRWVDPKKTTSILEFGPGIGQFSLAFLKSGFRVAAYEINKAAAEQLAANALTFGLEKDLTVNVGDFHKRQVIAESHQLVFVNPARSGLKSFTDEILKINPEHLIYVSCFPESMCEDLIKLKDDFKICNIIIVDQFPQTEHFEVCMLLEKLH